LDAGKATDGQQSVSSPGLRQGRRDSERDKPGKRGIRLNEKSERAYRFPGKGGERSPRLFSAPWRRGVLKIKDARRLDGKVIWRGLFGQVKRSHGINSLESQVEKRRGREETKDTVKTAGSVWRGGKKNGNS